MTKLFDRGKSSVIIAVLVILSVSFIPASSPVSQSGGKQSHRVFILPKSQESQGLYESCSPRNGASCLDRLKQMAESGFSLVLNYNQLSSTAGEELAYAKQAHSLGMKIIWAMDNQLFWDGSDLVSRLPSLAATCSCSDNEAFIRYVVNLVKNLPATWGYYVGDEVPVRDHARMKAFADLIRQLDPSHPRLFIAGASSVASVSSNLAPFVDTAEVVGVDYYPVGSNSMPISVTGKIAQAVQSLADRKGKQAVMVLQAFSWAQYPDESWRCSPFPACARFPRKNEMRQMRDLVLSHSHPQFILWYSYFDIRGSDNPSAHWMDLTKAVEANSRP